MVSAIHVHLDETASTVIRNTVWEVARVLAEERGIALSTGPASAAPSGALQVTVSTAAPDAFESDDASLEPHQPRNEGFTVAWNLAATEPTVSITSPSDRGASYGLFYLEDLLLSGELPEGSGTRVRVPFFVDRAGGILRFAQDEPPEFDTVEYAGWLARHGINVNGLHIGTSNLDANGAAAYEIDVTGGGSSNPFFSFWSSQEAQKELQVKIDAWEAEDPGCVVETLPRAHSGNVLPVLSIFSAVGRREYKRVWQEQFDANPRLRRMVFTFGDWGAVHGDTCPHVGQLPIHQRVIRWLEVSAEIVREIHPDIKVIARTWYYPREFIAAMIKDAPAGIGIRQKEPAGIVLEQPLGWELEQDNYSDVMLAIYELSSRFGSTYESGARRGVDFYPALAAGDTDESIDPVIGIPTPFVAALKIRRLFTLGMRNFAIWWGGLNYTAYSPNHEVIRSMIWEPEADPEAVVARIARRDVPEAPEATVAFWRAVERALAEWPYVNWKQQLETFVGRGKEPYKPPYLQPIARPFLEESQWCSMMRPNASLLARPTEDTARKLRDAVDEIMPIFERLEHVPSRARLRSGIGWTRLLASFLGTEAAVLRALALGTEEAGDGDRRETELGPIRSADIEACERAIEALQFIGRDDIKLSNRSQSTRQTIDQIQEKIDATRGLP